VPRSCVERRPVSGFQPEALLNPPLLSTIGKASDFGSGDKRFWSFICHFHSVIIQYLPLDLGQIMP
jgi:hypothetical protein